MVFKKKRERDGISESSLDWVDLDELCNLSVPHNGGGGYNVNGHPTIRQSTMKSSPSKVLIREVHQHCKQHGFS